MAAGIFVLVVFVFIPYNTFGDDIKQLKDSGLSLILVLAIIASGVGGQHVGGRRGRRQDGPDRALQAGQPPRFHPGQVRRHRLVGRADGRDPRRWLLITVAYKPIYDYPRGRLRDQPSAA